MWPALTIAVSDLACSAASLFDTLLPVMMTVLPFALPVLPQHVACGGLEHSGNRSGGSNNLMTLTHNHSGEVRLCYLLNSRVRWKFCFDSQNEWQTFQGCDYDRWRTFILTVSRVNSDWALIGALIGELLAFRDALTDGTARVSAPERKPSVCRAQIRLQSRVKTSKMKAFTWRRASEFSPFHLELLCQGERDLLCCAQDKYPSPSCQCLCRDWRWKRWN